MSEPSAHSRSSARALWVVERGTAELREEALKPPGPTQVLVQARFSAISRGTESLVFHGKVPSSEWERMRAPQQTGNFPWPVKYGYASVGRVVEGAGALLGCDVFCLFPHQDAYVVESDSVLPLPEGLPEDRAVLAANLETALNALWDAPVMIGDRVSVVGAGVVGCLVAFLAASQAEAEVELIDTNADRQRIAKALGASYRQPSSASRERDLVFHTSGTEAGLETAFALARSEGNIVDLSWYGDTLIRLPLGRDFHVRRLKLSSSQVGTVSPNARSRFNYRERLALALRLCRDPRLDVLFEADLPFDRVPKRLPELLSPISRALCQRIRY